MWSPTQRSQLVGCTQDERCLKGVSNLILQTQIGSSVPEFEEISSSSLRTDSEHWEEEEMVHLLTVHRVSQGTRISSSNDFTGF